MFNKKEKETRFEIKLKEQFPNYNGYIYVLVDKKTGVNYLNTCGTGSGITPLLDENGEIIIDK